MCPCNWPGDGEKSVLKHEKVRRKQVERLSKIEKALLGIMAAIVQSRPKNFKKSRLAANIAITKTTGVATSGAMFGLVSTIGTAGNGTAIATLSGAAQTSATLAWIGGLVGGGMAAGAVILPLAGIAGGLAGTKVVKAKIYGKSRSVEGLLQFEKEVLYLSEKLLRPVEHFLADEKVVLSEPELIVYARDGLVPYLNRLQFLLDLEKEGFHPSFRSTLKPGYYHKLSKHFWELDGLQRKMKVQQSLSFTKNIKSRLRFFSKSKLEDRKTLSRSTASVTVLTTLWALLNEQYEHMSFEQGLFLDALRRSKSDLNHASLDELSEYVKGLSPEGLTGMTANTKGIFHEMLFQQAEQNRLPGQAVQLKEDLNYPGADIEYYLDNELIKEVQLKATSSPLAVYEHLETYPDIDILVTEETAAIFQGIDGVGCSGFSNAWLQQEVTERLCDLRNQGILTDLSDNLAGSAFAASGVFVLNAARTGKFDDVDLSGILTTLGISTGVSTVVEVVLG